MWDGARECTTPHHTIDAIEILKVRGSVVATSVKWKRLLRAVLRLGADDDEKTTNRRKPDRTQTSSGGKPHFFHFPLE